MEKNLYFSIIIPVYNRPDEVDELLQSLENQSNKNFDVIIVEDGSKIDCKTIVEKFNKKLNISYYYKDNSGPGDTRNFGAQRAKGDYFIFFDSDCIIPEKYFEVVNQTLKNEVIDAYGGPDMAHPSFTPVQKAINYSMTSFITTGGIRGGGKKMDKFHPRSFNMGFSRRVYEATKGYSKMRFGEDVDLSLRIVEAGFKTQLIPEAAVYHKRRTNFKKFFKQVFNSGIARINLYKRHPKSLKIVHLFPSAFVIGMIFCILLTFFHIVFITPVILFIVIVLLDSFRMYKSFKISALSVLASFTQLFSYGTGFIKAVWKRLILKQKEFEAYSKNFYK